MLKWFEIAEQEQAKDYNTDDDFFQIIEKTLKENQYKGAKIYFHMDLDGVASALAMKELLKQYGLPVVQAEPTQYGTIEHSVETTQPGILPVLVDFAHKKKFIKLHTDHHSSQTGVDEKSKIVHAPSNAGYIADMANMKGGNAFNQSNDKEIIDVVDSAGFLNKNIELNDVVHSIDAFKKDPNNNTYKQLMTNTLLLAYKNKKIKTTGEKFLSKLVIECPASFDGMFNFMTDPANISAFRLPGMEQIAAAKKEYEANHRKDMIDGGEKNFKGKKIKISEGHVDQIKDMKPGESLKIGNTVVQFGMKMGDPVFKGGYDRYTVFLNYPDVNFLVIGWPMGLVQASKNPSKEGQNVIDLGKLMDDVVTKKYKNKWRKWEIDLDKLKYTMEKDVKSDEAVGFKFEDLMSLLGDVDDVDDLKLSPSKKAAAYKLGFKRKKISKMKSTSNLPVDNVDLKKDKETRIKFGDVAEIKVMENLRNRGYYPKQVKEMKGYNTKMDLTNGDIFIYNEKLKKPVKIDVKRGASVTINSVKNFRGDVYLFVPGKSLSLKNAYVITAKAVKIYYEQNKDKIKKLPSGAKGIKIPFKEIKEKVKYDDWVKTGFQVLSKSALVGPMDKFYSELSYDEKDYLKNFKISAWDLIQATSGGHKDITNLSSLDYFRKNDKNYVTDVIKSVMTAMTKELSRVKLKYNKEGEETFEDYIGRV